MEKVQTKTPPAKKSKTKKTGPTSQEYENYLQRIRFHKWALPGILLVTFICYLPSLFAGFVNWDDGDYSYNNIFIRSLTNIRDILTTPVQGNYHPLTMLTLAINYAISGTDAWSYHLFNVLLHLVNCALVFKLGLVLSRQNYVVAFTTSLLFAIHPMHVESVAWVSERKDVLYSLFFLFGLISYTRYVDTQAKKHYIWTIIFCLLSLLSKPAAVIFPLTLFAIDLLRKRALTWRLALEKIPMFIPAVFIGYLTYTAQKAIGAATTTLFPLTSRIFMGFYGMMAYVGKMIFPVNLATFYPFPALNEPLPTAYYISPLFFLLLAAGFYFSYKRSRLLAFSIGFYLINLILVLQFLTVGSAIIADRYTYMPFIGFFFYAGWLVYRHIKPRAALYLFGITTVLLSVLCFRQVLTWQNGATLWDQAIKVAPSYKAYVNRATLLKEEKDYPRALEYFSEAIRLNPEMGNDAYIYRGNIYFDEKKYDLAYNDYKKALTISQNDFTVLHNIGVVYAFRNQADSALKYYGLCLEKNPGYKPAYNSRGVLHMNQEKYHEAIVDFQNYLRFEPEAANIYNVIGTCYRYWLKQDSSLHYINRAIQIDPNPHYILNRAMTHGAMNNYELARRDALKAKEAGLKIDPEMLRELKLE